jgi:CRP-like cAMP-binding protein
MGAVLTRTLENLAKFSRDEAAMLAGLAQKSVREIQPRRDLIREGDAAAYVYIMLDGWAARYKALPDGRRQIVAFALPGDVFDIHVVPFGPMDHSIAAITSLRVAEIERDAFDGLIAEHPGLGRSLWRQERQAIAVQREWTLNVGQRTALERIAHILCELYMRLDNAGHTRSGSCAFPLTQVDLAEATGLTPVHVNRTLQELRRKRLIELQHRMLTIPDLAALQLVGLFNPAYLQIDKLRA